MKKSVFWNAIIGMGFGFPITVACMAMLGGFDGAARELLVWVGASALYGVFSGLAYHWKLEVPLPVSLGLHCLGCLLITVAAVLLNGYVKCVGDLVPVLVPRCLQRHKQLLHHRIHQGLDVFQIQHHHLFSISAISPGSCAYFFAFSSIISR